MTSVPDCVNDTSSVENRTETPRSSAARRSSGSSTSCGHSTLGAGLQSLIRRCISMPACSPGVISGHRASASVGPTSIPVNDASAALASVTASVRPSARNTSVLRGLNRRAFGCGEVLACFSTSTVRTPCDRSSSAAVSPAIPPPLTRTCVRSVSMANPQLNCVYVVHSMYVVHGEYDVRKEAA